MRSIFSSFPEGLLPGPDVLDLENHRRLAPAAVDGILDKLNIRLERHGGRHLGHIRQFNAVFIPVHVRAVLFSPDRKSTRLNSSHTRPSRMPSSA